MTDHIRTRGGLDAVRAMFETAKSEGRAAFLPYFPIGFPTYDQSLAVIEAMAGEGVDGFEIGIPFSDPLADGPTIQAATQKALENGITVRHCLEAVRTLRAKGVDQPMLMMGYLNPMLAYGVDAFTRDVRAAGADGLIIPDLPPEEADAMAAACEREGLALIFFLAPTSKPERIGMVGKLAKGFIYVVSLTGVTGARTDLPPGLSEFIARVRAQVTDVPLVMGFGISTPAHVKLVSQLTDGFIVGSALVKAGGESVEAARSLTAQLRGAL